MNQIFELSSNERLVRSYLEKALDGSSPSAVSIRTLQRFATETPELFCNAAVTLVESDCDPAACRFMMILLRRQPELFRLLSDPVRIGKAGAIKLFRELLKHDALLDVRFAQCLPNRYGVSEMRLSLAAFERALDLLDEVSEGRRIVPILGHLVDHSVPWISAKATLIVGRRVQSVVWAKRLLTPDRAPRNRANALETLWGLDHPDARTLMWEHTADKNNRVAGNAVFGLHAVGETNVIPVIRQMAHHIEPEFRWTSAWLMSRIAREQHTELLKQLVKDDNPGVRRSAFKALVEIRQEELKQSEQQQLTINTEASEEQAAQLEALRKAQHAPEKSSGLLPDFSSTDGHFRSR